MSRLIKAEWYRVTKTYHLLFWTVMLCVLFTFISWMQINEELCSGNIAFGKFMESASMILMYMAILVGGMYVTAYQSKMLNYEIMAGNKISKILLSKAVIVTPILTVILTGLAGFIYVYFGESQGYGELDYMAIRFVLFGLLVIRVCLCSIFIMTTFKSIIGMLVLFLRFMVLEGVGLVIAMIFENSDYMADIMCVFIQGQTTVIGSAIITTSTVVVCIVSGIVEALFWYVLSYNGYKKKLFS